MNWTNGPLCCTLDAGGFLVAQCVKQADGTWAGFDLSGDNGAVRIGGYPNLDRARLEVEKHMAAKMGHLGRIPLAPIAQQIGVHDYDSLTKLLENTWTRLYDSPARDPQDIIQHMEAEILRWRRADSEEEESRL